MRRKPDPDKRLDWRDPEMPVLVQPQHRQMIEVTPDYIQLFYEQKLADPFYNAPSWKADPTYDLKKRKKVLK